MKPTQRKMNYVWLRNLTQLHGAIETKIIPVHRIKLNVHLLP